MGRRKKNNSKAKAKKLARKAEVAQTAQWTAAVRRAAAAEDIFALMPAFRKYQTPDGREIELTFHDVSEMDSDEVGWAFGLLKANMEAMYVESGWGWDDDQKLSEMTAEGMKYVIATDVGSGERLGYAEFMYTIEKPLGVALYVYEIQLAPDARRAGLGRRLMQVMELAAAMLSVPNVLLTVFTANVDALAFYTALKYQPNTEVEGAAPTWNEHLQIHEDPAWHLKILQALLLVRALLALRPQYPQSSK
ncbi:N-acetyltransferase 11 [Thecamonas trahens ATCC 50062]|uniref:N-alpha-acetyltransferase 40 n=1 Tax=Thecamonas trahens ATCC 50062 TaxID=461836 RepID=A0A0L0DJH7_THETB|nr:N-acetyltransferase 11 [Thecamonas trahens ATCC 50062]KNC52241.1 N-acetyltransferase 11 [Thecamonas trahens ATCC 50062]|eukprot:XP_013762243.1 N-acetyltransferase 11 [Thecamonas trahens ATCC 50062]